MILVDIDKSVLLENKSTKSKCVSYERIENCKTYSDVS